MGVATPYGSKGPRRLETVWGHCILNRVTVPNKYTLPHIEDFTAFLHSATIH